MAKESGAIAGRIHHRPLIRIFQGRAGRLIVASQDAVIFSGTGILDKG